MRIVLISGLSSVHTIKWANGLCESGHDVHVISQHKPCNPVSPEVKVHMFPYMGAVGYFLMVPFIKLILKKINPDIVNAHYASGYGTTAILAGFRPTIISVWGSEVYEFPYKSFLHKFLIKRNLLKANRVTSTSKAMVHQIRQVVPELNLIDITPFGINVDNFSIVNPLSLNNTKIIIGTVKTMDDKYGIDILINAFSLLYKELLHLDPDIAEQIQLRLVGGGPKTDALSDYVDRLGLSNKIQFIGRVLHDDVPAELEKIDIYVVLSRQESFGVAVLEASAASRPVVVSDVGGLPEVVVDGVTGFIVPSEDPKSASEALLKLVIDPKLRLKMGSDGHKYVSSTYNWCDSVRTMEHIYKSTIEAN